ncbi:MAG TPA: fibronectin type III domain-containing protein [Terriglobales bacterium]|jgi:phosphodiesterase/alkaline phosphatase D-like protein|nr:fibronectin type III domain-containing protein [Terriglobales bacterium]
MRRSLVSLAACFALGTAICAQAASRPARQDKDKDKDAQAKHAQKAPQVKIIHGPVVESAKPTTATIAWSTNVKASTILKYGSNPGSLNKAAEARWGGTTHRVYLHDLKPGTTYYYRVESTQALGTGSQTLSGVEHFRTEGGAAAAAPTAAKAADVKLTHGPVVEGTSAKGATIAWSTNVPASSILTYGTNPQSLNQTAEVRWGGLTHRVNLRNLQPGTTYYYEVKSTQAQGTGTQAASGVQTFRTKGATATAATPAQAADVRGRDMALRNFHQFLVSHPNVKADLQKNPNLAVNGRYRTQHPGFNQFLQTHHAVQAYLSQNPRSFLQSEDAMR